MKHKDDMWGEYRLEAQEERNFAEVARRRVNGLIAAVRWRPNMSLQSMLASAYMQGANDILSVQINRGMKPRLVWSPELFGVKP